MTIENDLPLKASVDDNDLTRGVSEEGESIQVLNSVLKTYLGEGTATPFIEVVGTGDDRGLICTEQWSVGKVSAPKESVFGGGESYGVGLEDTTPDGTPKAGSAWHCDIANTTGLVITSATDITTELSSDTGSTTPLFGGTTAGKYILIGSDYTAGGVKAKIDTLGSVASASMVGEYLADSSTWVNAPYMVTDADAPYEQKGNNIATCSSCSEQWRFGFNPLQSSTPWDKVTLNINGVDYTKYWARFRLVDVIVTDPIMEQLKIHTSRYEVNKDGATEYFGRARYARTIEAEISSNSDSSPANEDIKIASGVTLAGLRNQFSNSQIHGLIIQGIVPEGLDTSIPLQIKIDWYAVGTGSGDVELQLDTINTGSDFTYDGSGTLNATTPSVTSIANQPEERQTSVFLVSGENALPADTIYGSLYRDATPANLDDTFEAAIVITNAQLIGYFWKP